MNRKRILFYNEDKAGVNYYRTKTPAIQLQKNDSLKEFYVEISNRLDPINNDTLEYLKSFDIINYHRYLSPNFGVMKYLVDELRKSNVRLVMDIDDYWELPKTHPQYSTAKETNHSEIIKNNLLMADYVTTTTEILAEEIKKITKKDNVFVFYNSVNPEWMTQFENNWKKDPNGLVRITYLGGSSHLQDLQQFIGVTNVLKSDLTIKDKFKIILAGWDSKGYIKETVFNKDLLNELKRLNLWTPKIVHEVNKSNGDIWKIKSIPKHIKEKYENKLFVKTKRDIEIRESIYYDYEKILTDNYKIIDDKMYHRWLMNFEIGGIYPNENGFARRWTKPANEYANVLNETDIVIAPLEDIKFNNLKSNLKQVECWSRKIPVVCSNIAPYNIYGKHMENCVLIPNKKNAKKYWVRGLKKLILDENLRKKIGEGLYNDFNQKFNLKNVTDNRIDFYRKITEKE